MTCLSQSICGNAADPAEAQELICEWAKAGIIDFEKDIVLCPKNGKKREDDSFQEGTVNGLNAALLAIDRDRCVTCNTYSQVCPSGNFRITDNGLEFSGSCEYCLACVHSCPQKALYLKAGERNREARYRHPEVSLGEIIRSNKQ